MFKLGFALILIVLTISAMIGGFCWPYAINAIGVLFLHKEVHVAFWQGALLGFVPYIGQFAIPAAVIMWVLTLILG